MGWFDSEPSKDAYDKGRSERKVRLKGGPYDGQEFTVKRLESTIEVRGEKYEKQGDSMFGESTVTYRHKKKGW